MSHGESMEEDDMVKSMAIASYRERDEPMRREGLQAYKEVPRPSRGLALAAAKRSLISREPYIN